VVVVVEGGGTAVMLTPYWPAFSSEPTAEELLPRSTVTCQLGLVATKEAPSTVTVVEVFPDPAEEPAVVGEVTAVGPEDWTCEMV
jgi:hypothetical protein